MLQLAARPERAHDAAAGVRVGAEEQVTDFMRDREAEQRRPVRVRLRREPFHAVHEDRRQPTFARAGVYQGVSELELSAGRRRERQADETN